MEVLEIDFNDSEVMGTIPVVVYSTLGLKPNGDLLRLINIEPLNNAKEMIIEVFGNGNFYSKGIIESNTGKLNIFSFRCENDNRYFIKIMTHEFRENTYDDLLLGDTEDSHKVDMLFYGFYKFETNLLDFLDIPLLHIKNKKEKLDRNISIDIKEKPTSIINHFKIASHANSKPVNINSDEDNQSSVVDNNMFSLLNDSDTDNEEEEDNEDDNEDDTLVDSSQTSPVITGNDDTENHELQTHNNSYVGGVMNMMLNQTDLLDSSSSDEDGTTSPNPEPSPEPSIAGTEPDETNVEVQNPILSEDNTNISEDNTNISQDNSN